MAIHMFSLEANQIKNNHILYYLQRKLMYHPYYGSYSVAFVEKKTIRKVIRLTK